MKLIKKTFKRKGISPVIATVLLIAMVIVIGLIIFLWFRSLTQEAVTKFGGTNVELVCEDISFSATYDSSGILTLSNLGNVPIYRFKLQISGGGSFETKDIQDVSSWPQTGLGQGGLFSEDLSSEFFGEERVVVIPVLIGNSDRGEQTHVCAERHGQEIIL